VVSRPGIFRFPIYWVPQRVGSDRPVRLGSNYNPFPIYWVPQRVGSAPVVLEKYGHADHSRFPIYWVPQRVGRGNYAKKSEKPSSFQFIGFPSEWGVHPNGPRVGSSYVFPIYWVPQRVGSSRRATRSISLPASFQFIGFPSEWGVEALLSEAKEGQSVSNLLGSPASGEKALLSRGYDPQFVSNLLGSPASGELNAIFGNLQVDSVSNLLGSPASGEVAQRVVKEHVPLGVSNLLGSPASGEIPLLKPAWIGNVKGHLRAPGKIVIHCTVSEPQKSPQTPSGSHIERLDEKMGISRFWLGARITEPGSWASGGPPHHSTCPMVCCEMGYNLCYK
jgi:hypothetical protein